MRSRINRVLALVLVLLAPVVAHAAAPSVATLDAEERAGGNRKAIAEAIGRELFGIEWPAQIMKVSANEAAGHLVVGLKISGVKFHRPLTRAGFTSEIATVVERTFAADRGVDEVDVWAAVPLTVGKGVIVAGDLATPTTRNVFTLSVERPEGARALGRRIASGRGVYWDEEWARTTLKQGR